MSTVLLVDDDPTTLAHFRAVLEHEPSLRVETAINGKEGLARALELVPDLIISDYSMPEMDGFEFCRRAKAEPALTGCLFVILSGFSDTALKVRGLNLGVDDYLTKPIEVAELLARVRATLRISGLQEQLREDKQELERLHRELGESFDGLLHLLIHLIDLGLPGAAERGKRLDKLARELATRFDVPEELGADLGLAAQLHEIGKVVDAAHHAAGAPAQPDWHYAVVSSSLLDQVPRLRGAAEVIAGLFENWDGTGMPNHWVSGQIPLRARILRVAIDFLRLLEQEERQPRHSAASAIEAMQAHQGTWYDPLALVHLESVALDRPRDEWLTTRQQITVDQLNVGMVLAADLSTSSGVKLLARGTTISRSMLDVIARRHLADPIIDGVWINR
ncbi:MAG TPA: HD domain-containing phosphohydrolase [Gemmatimonadales bacterium]|nr:HD domain-containing phosphohydrolase [Gemmatimonadales bacterium]